MVSSHAATEAATAAPPRIAGTPTQRAKPRGPSMCFSDRLPRNLALRSYRHRPVGSGEMRNFLSEHSGVRAFGGV